MTLANWKRVTRESLIPCTFPNQDTDMELKIDDAMTRQG